MNITEQDIDDLEYILDLVDISAFSTKQTYKMIERVKQLKDKLKNEIKTNTN